jgi:hypothetical protein
MPKRGPSFESINRRWFNLSLLIRLVPGILLAATVAAASSSSLIGQVVRVVDGETIAVRIGDRTETVRYIGVRASALDHPEKRKQYGAREATEANRQFVEDQPVRLELDVQERDRDGRLLAYVYVGDLMVERRACGSGPHKGHDRTTQRQVPRAISEAPAGGSTAAARIVARRKPANNRTRTFR